MTWLREAVSDDGGLADMAYIAIGALTVAAIFALAFIFAMSAIDYYACQPVASVTTSESSSTKGKDKGEARTVDVKRCKFDPLPIGQAAGLIFGAFGALIGALAGYMAATRRTGKQVTTTAEASISTVTTQDAKPAPAKVKRR